MTQNYTRICVFDEDDFGQWICTEQELFNHLSTLNTAEYPIEKIPTDTLYWAIEPSLTDVWPNDLLYHFERMRSVDYHYPIVIYNTQVVDGVHRIAQAHLLGLTELNVIRIPTIPTLRYVLKEPYGAVSEFFTRIPKLIFKDS